MDKLKLYYYIDENTNEEKITTREMPITSSKLKYWLTASPGHYLYNSKYDVSRKSIIIPFYELNDWEERQLEDP